MVTTFVNEQFVKSLKYIFLLAIWTHPISILWVLNAAFNNILVTNVYGGCPFLDPPQTKFEI
jgi:hypothetical protein